MKRADTSVILLKIISVSILLLAVVLLYFDSEFILTGELYVRKDSMHVSFRGDRYHLSKVLQLIDPKTIDLSDCSVLPEEYDVIREKYPESRILWKVPLSSGMVDNESDEITIDAISSSDIPLFAYFKQLREVNASGVTDWQNLAELEVCYPEIRLDWGIFFNERYYSSTLKELKLKDPVPADEMMDKLGAFTKLEKVRIEFGGLTVEEQLALVRKYPGLDFEWKIRAFGRNISNHTANLYFSEESALDLDLLAEIAPLLINIEKIDFTRCDVENEEMLCIMNAYPEADVIWNFPVYGVEVCSTAEEIDLSKIPIEDIGEIEDALPYMKHLKKVIMSDCGISDEDMDALDKRHEDVRFVWTVHFGKGYALRTDETTFIASLYYGYPRDRRDLTDKSIQPLKYCTDMIAIDVGHMYYTNVDFCKNMKKLKWLIIGDSLCRDISALSNCKELYYLEMFSCYVTDFTPLLECKELRHLNICNLHTGDSLDVIAQMTWLERLWMSGPYSFRRGDRAYLYSDEFLPDTQKRLSGYDCTGDGWRRHPAYYEMRDIFGVYYLP